MPPTTGWRARGFRTPAGWRRCSRRGLRSARHEGTEGREVQVKALHELHSFMPFMSETVELSRPSPTLPSSRDAAVMSDEDLMLAVRGGDRDAFAALFDRYQERDLAVLPPPRCGSHRRRGTDARDLPRRPPGGGALRTARAVSQLSVRHRLQSAGRRATTDAERARSSTRRAAGRADGRRAGSGAGALGPPGASPVSMPDDREILMLREYDAARLRRDRRAVRPAGRHGPIAPVPRAAGAEGHASTRPDRRRSPDEAHPFVRS